jgi:endonuclease/exonuclease/phosphatase family metal-dependent hydrolase
MTYNIHCGVPSGGGIGNYRVGEAELSSLAAVIQGARPDVAAMQEVDCEFGLTLPVQKRRSSALNMPRVLAAMTTSTYVFGSAQDDYQYPSDNAGYVEWGTAGQWQNNASPHGEVGNALLLRVPLARPPENIPLPKATGQERRACLRVALATGQGGGCPVVVYACHLQHDNGGTRVEQIRAILQRARGEPPTATVFILGDLNHDANAPSGPAEDVMRAVAEAGFHDLHAAFAAASGGAAAATFPADKPTERIDFVLCNRALNVVDARVLEGLASDHRPLIVTVELPG